jgi:hypothetical protein
MQNDCFFIICRVLAKDTHTFLLYPLNKSMWKTHLGKFFKLWCEIVAINLPSLNYVYHRLLHHLVNFFYYPRTTIIVHLNYLDFWAFSVFNLCPLEIPFSLISCSIQWQYSGDRETGHSGCFQ